MSTLVSFVVCHIQRAKCLVWLYAQNLVLLYRLQGVSWSTYATVHQPYPSLERPVPKGDPKHASVWILGRPEI